MTRTGILAPLLLLVQAACSSGGEGGDVATVADSTPAPPAPARADTARGGGIAAARMATLEETADVVGIVTAPAGTVGPGFPLQEGGVGIFVVARDSTDHAVGDRVRVMGRLVEENGLRGIVPVRMERMGPGEVPAPRRSRTAEVGEAHEGVLLEVEGTVRGDVVDDRPYGWKVTLDDGSGPLLVFVTAGTDVDVAAIRDGQRLRVTGIGGQYQTHYELLPRGRADVVSLPGS